MELIPEGPSCFPSDRNMKNLILIGLLTLGGPILAAPPNVVVFLTDDQGTLDANCYGSEDLYTPAIDDLAKTGVRFTQAYAHTVCCPALALPALVSAPSMAPPWESSGPSDVRPRRRQHTYIH